MADIMPFRARNLLAPLGALALASALALLVVPARSGGRVANLAVEAAPLPEAYIMRHRSEPGMGYLVDRRSSTMRRDRASQAGRKRRLERVPSGAQGVRDTWLLRSRLLGTVLFTPLEAVGDWSLPFLYAWLGEQLPDAALPEVGWVHLSVDRIYQGLYMRTALPVDARKKEGGTGRLRVFLEIDGKQAARINSRFEDGPGPYMALLAMGKFPMPVMPDRKLGWLAAMSNLPTTTIEVAAEPPHGLRLIPMPVALAPLFERARGRPPARVEDVRIERWRQAVTPEVPQPFDEAHLAAMQAVWPAWVAAFTHGLVLHHSARDLPMPTADAVAARLAAVDGLGLKAGGQP